ncbi:MAG: hypothetical protein U9N78_06075 [Actinomycetota bacterium]|nr:hypothetical protein [Actinomycetota bacterium]
MHNNPRHALMRALTIVSAFGLVLAACGTSGGALDESGDQITTPPIQDTTTSMPGTTSTTVASTTTTAVPELASITRNAGDLEVIVLPDADGQLPGDTMIGCNGARMFPVSALDHVAFLSESDLPDVEEAIRPFLEGGEGAFWPQEDWRVLHRTDDHVLLVYSDPAGEGPRIAFMDVDKEGDEWRWGGSSMGDECPLEVAVHDRLGDVEWRLDPTAESLTLESTVIHVLVTGRQCSDGQPLGDRLLGPQVVVTDTEVLIAFAAQPLGGAHTCPGNPEEPVTIELSGPIGGRVVANGLALDESLEQLLQS